MPKRYNHACNHHQHSKGGGVCTTVTPSCWVTIIDIRECYYQYYQRSSNNCTFSFFLILIFGKDDIETPT